MLFVKEIMEDLNSMPVADLLDMFHNPGLVIEDGRIVGMESEK